MGPEQGRNSGAGLAWRRDTITLDGYAASQRAVREMLFQRAGQHRFWRNLQPLLFRQQLRHRPDHQQRLDPDRRGFGSILLKFWPDISRKYLQRDSTHRLDAQARALEAAEKQAN